MEHHKDVPRRDRLPGRFDLASYALIRPVGKDYPMRISAGTAKGRRIGFKKAFRAGDDLRPTSAKVREALFDIIGDRLSGAVFLDLYAGTGGVGLEALSRGAAKVVFVESSRPRLKMIERHLGEFGFAERSVTVGAGACDFVRREAEDGRRYDIVFVDPPYHSGELTEVLMLIGEGKVLEERSMVIAEHFVKTDLPDVVRRLRLSKSYRYGDTVLSVFRLGKEEGA